MTLKAVLLAQFLQTVVPQQQISPDRSCSPFHLPLSIQRLPRNPLDTSCTSLNPSFPSSEIQFDKRHICYREYHRVSTRGSFLEVQTWMPNKLLYWRSQNDAANHLWASYLGSKQICCIYSSSSAQPCQVPLKLGRISLQQKPHVSRHRRFPHNTQGLGWDATESTALGDVPA